MILIMRVMGVIEFFKDNFDVIVQVVYFVIVVIMTLYNLFRGKNIKENLKEIENFMKYRTSSTPIETASQSFSTVRDKLEYDPATGKLVKVGEIDLVELVQSSVQDCMSEFLRHYMEQEEENSIESISMRYKQNRYDLQTISDALDLISDYRDMYDLDPDKVSDKDVFAFIQKEGDKLMEAYKDSLKHKEVNIDGSQTQGISQTEQAAVSALGSESAQEELEKN